MIKIAALISLNSDCRFVGALSEGLIVHPEIEPYFSIPVVQYDKVLAKGLDVTYFQEMMLECDYIFRPIPGGDSKRLPIEHLKFFDENNLWHKTIAFDPQDDAAHVCEEALDKAFLYVKRAYSPSQDPRIFPVNLSVLSAYENSVPVDSEERTIDIGTFYQYDRLLADSSSYIGRLNLYDMTHANDWGGFTTVFEQKYSHRPSYATVGDAICTDDPIGTPPEQRWIHYHNQLAKTKIILTCWPTSNWSDNRTWEALASGACCFVDKLGTQVPGWDLEHKKHCYIYDAYNGHSIQEALIQAKKYLTSEREERLQIATACREHIAKTNKGVHRIDQIVQEVKKRK